MEKSGQELVTIEEFVKQIESDRICTGHMHTMYREYMFIRALPPTESEHLQFTREELRSISREVEETLQTYNDHVNGILIPYFRLSCTVAYIKKKIDNVVYFRPYFDNCKNLSPLCYIDNADMDKDEIEKLLDHNDLSVVIERPASELDKTTSFRTTSLLKSCYLPKTVDLFMHFFKFRNRVKEMS